MLNRFMLSVSFFIAVLSVMFYQCYAECRYYTKYRSIIICI
jgi:hypothetical protein